MDSKILIVDDDPDIALLLARDLKEAGWEVIFAENGREGYERAIFERPVLIILDIYMPRMNGIETLRKLRENDSVKEIPVIMFSGSKSPQDIKTVQELGVRGFFHKDEKYSKVTETVKMVLAGLV